MATRDNAAAARHIEAAHIYASQLPPLREADPQTIAAIATMHATIASMHLLADLNRRL